ncbi:AAA family ATPase [Saccharopolyspora sp. TS4A08]|uniref:AAA family ATPase n=1 Tax=Saccharopolyspora ipomoeae TaxID=3042027 RepID=A0ABT6PQT5_9PSEU|nr:bifunctional aminoglycoside phosphotransferase/ATP-binding protein [Saccharopolyspora sp. TS4A08]MDI2030262.1 AAA family ATPase [Saccharopolyspora sp. TS4A08]
MVFIGDRAYKVKKPVDFGFLNFTSAEARRVACVREVELNRRLTPDVYLDLSEVLDGEGRSCDWIVVMRRMPPESRLATLVERGVDVRADLEQLARKLASFHSTAKRGPDVESAGRSAALRRRWVDNFAGAEPFAGIVLDRDTFDDIARLALDYVDGRGRLLEDRVRRGYVVDGHGDLQAEDIFCLSDGPRVLDCLEFDDELRYVDGLDDAAFLAMDLERLGAPVLGREFLDWYAVLSGAQVARSLADHYIAYRAFVRSKVACLRHEQGVAAAADDARILAAMALEHLRSAQVRLVLVGGLPGVGKSTVAGALADRMGGVLLRTDQIRRELPHAAGLDPGAGYGRGLYEGAQVHDTYGEMFARCRRLLEHGESVVLDASWSNADERDAARVLARETRAAITELRCEAPKEVAVARLAARADDPSDATAEIAEEMAGRFAAWPEGDTVDTAGTPESAGAAAWKVLQARR